MDERMSVRVLTSAAISTCLALAPAAQAQALMDPTRPPDVAPHGAAGTVGAPGAAPASRLQSVLIAPGRRIAVIDGVTVPLGGKIGDATLVRVSETEVVLRRDGQNEVLKLLPGIDRKFVKRAARAGVKTP